MSDMVELAPFDRSMLDAVADFSLRISAPISWHEPDTPWPRTLRGGTCFFLRFADNIVGVTANHVIEIFEAATVKTPGLICQLRLTPFNPGEAIIDRDPGSDIATFRCSEELLTLANTIAVDCRADWPPPIPERMRALSVCGFPEQMRKTNHKREVEFAAWGALAAVEDITDRNILITYDPKIVRPSRWAPAMPPVGLNLSGCSGGPVLMHGERNGLFRWFPVALVIAGPRPEMKEGEAQEFDMIHLRRIHMIRPDGGIVRNESGWLPRA